MAQVGARAPRPSAEAWVDDGKGPFDLRVTPADLRRGELKQGERLREDKEMLFAPGTRQSEGDLLGILFTTIVAHSREGAGSRSPATIARMMCWPVTPVTSLSACDNWIFICKSACCMWRTWGARCSMSWARWRKRVRSATRSASGRNEAGASRSVQGLNPLTVHHVALAAWHVFHRLRR